MSMHQNNAAEVTAQPLILTDEQLEHIAEKAANRAIEKLTDHVYKQVGKSVISKLLYIIGVVSVAGWLWLKKQGAV